jgi:hypothetical protein
MNSQNIKKTIKSVKNTIDESINMLKTFKRKKYNGTNNVLEKSNGKPNNSLDKSNMLDDTQNKSGKSFVGLEPIGLSTDEPVANILSTSLSPVGQTTFNWTAKHSGLSKAKQNLNIIKKINKIANNSADTTDKGLTLLGGPEHTGYNQLLRTIGVPASNSVSNVLMNLTSANKNEVNVNNKTKKTNNLMQARMGALKTPQKQSFAGLIRDKGLKQITNSMRKNAERIRKSRHLEQAKGRWKPNELRGGKKTRKIKRSRKTHRSKRHQSK